MESPKDWRGTPIREGCTIVYPGRNGGLLWMTEAIVEEIEEVDLLFGISKPVLKVRRTLTTKNDSKSGRLTTITALDRVTVVASPAAPDPNGSQQLYRGYRGSDSPEDPA